LFSQGFLPDDVFAHPRHEAAQKALPDLIVQLRAAANVKEGYELQQELIGHVRETEEARNAFSKAVKRIQDGKPPQPDAPEPGIGCLQCVGAEPDSQVYRGVDNGLPLHFHCGHLLLSRAANLA